MRAGTLHLLFRPCRISGTLRDVIQPSVMVPGKGKGKGKMGKGKGKVRRSMVGGTDEYPPEV